MRAVDDHVLALDQVLVLHLAFLIDDSRVRRGVAKASSTSAKLCLTMAWMRGAGERSDVEIVGRFRAASLFEFFLDFVAAQRSEALQGADRGLARRPARRRGW